MKRSSRLIDLTIYFNNHPNVRTSLTYFSERFKAAKSSISEDLAILKKYYELGGRLITIGADAHKPEHVGLRFDLLPQLLTGIGFREYAVYRKRSPILYPLC